MRSNFFNTCGVIGKAFLGLTLFSSFSFSQEILTLQKAINLVKTQNWQVKSAFSQYLADKYGYYTQIGKRFGQVTLFWNYSQYKYQRVVAPISPPLNPSKLASDDQVRIYGWRYDVRLFDGCQQFFLIMAKKHKSQTSFLTYDKTIKQKTEQVKEKYLQLLSLKARKEALLKRLVEVKKLYEIVKTAYEVGKRPLLDLLNVKAELKNVEAAIKNVDAEIQTTKSALATLLNLKTLDFDVKDVLIKPKFLDQKLFLNIVLANNPDVKVISEQKQVSDYYKKAAIAEFSPKVNFSYKNLKYSYDDTTKSDWQYTISVSFPIFDFGVRFFNYKKAYEMERKVNYLRHLTVKKVLDTYTSLIDNLNTQIDVIDATKAKLEFAKEAYKLQKEKYQLGKADIYDLLKAEALYYNTLGDYKVSIYKWGILKAKLDYLLGK
jgi:outer membrane protein